MDYDSLLSLCRSRKSCRSFSSEALPEDVSEKIMELVSTCPFASGRKSWKVAVVRESEQKAALVRAVREEIEKLCSGMDGEAAGFFSHYAESFYFFEQAPLVFIPYCRETSTMKSLLRESVTPELLLWEHDTIVKSLSCVATYILLAAESLGLGACYMTGPLAASSALRSILGLRENMILGAIIPVGIKA